MGATIGLTGAQTPGLSPGRVCALGVSLGKISGMCYLRFSDAPTCGAAFDHEGRYRRIHLLSFWHLPRTSRSAQSQSAWEYHSQF